MAVEVPSKAIVVEASSDATKTILVVDDDELVRRVAIGVIESLGYRVVSARSGPEALEILRGDTSIDLLFTDVVMPGAMHGPQLVAQARLLRPELKILYTSGYLDYRALRGGLDPRIEQLKKPYRRDELAAKLRSVLDS
jgi:CheY-like chemotaxis protein